MLILTKHTFFCTDILSQISSIWNQNYSSCKLYPDTANLGIIDTWTNSHHVIRTLTYQSYDRVQVKKIQLLSSWVLPMKNWHDQDFFLNPCFCSEDYPEPGTNSQNGPTYKDLVISTQTVSTPATSSDTYMSWTAMICIISLFAFPIILIELANL